MDVINSLYRLRQIYDLISIYSEAHTTFRKIINIKNNRKDLSPNENVERETLNLATDDYALKLSKLKSEAAYLKHHLSLFIGEECKFEKKVLPSEVKLDHSFDQNSDLNAQN